MIASPVKGSPFGAGQRHIVNLQNTVWRYPGSRRLEKVDASNSGYAVSAVRLRNEEEYLPLGNNILESGQRDYFGITVGILVTHLHRPCRFRCLGCAVRLVHKAAYSIMHDQ